MNAITVNSLTVKVNEIISNMTWKKAAKGIIKYVIIAPIALYLAFVLIFMVLFAALGGMLIAVDPVACTEFAEEIPFIPFDVIFWPIW
jgi:DNA integrity scanning protein DisA with diadenylate cyclase activity